MTEQTYQPGDIIYAVNDILNDGSIPELPEQSLIATAGTRGVVLNIGHLEEFPDKSLYLARFESGEEKTLGPAIGCWPEELTQHEENKNSA